MSLLSRAIEIYKRDGLISLLRRSKLFLASEIIPKTVWTILPEAKTKRIIGKSKILTNIFYFIRGVFYHEQRALLYGQSFYIENEVEKADPIYSITRSTHRIEKGLSMKNRRDVFAEGYIIDLVGSLEQVVQEIGNNECVPTQLEWTLDVLDEYFSVVDHTEPIENAYDLYLELIEKLDYTPGDKRPFPHGEIQNSGMNFESFAQLAETRHSVRWFKQKDVDRDLIDDAISVAVESPSACNRQSFRFYVFDDDDLIDELASIPGGAKSYKNNIPCLVILVGRQRAYFHDRDKHVIYIDASLAAMTFQYALESMGLGSCCINWQSIPRNQRKVRKKLNLDPDEKVIMYMAVGYPDPEGRIPYSEKKSLDDIRSYNHGKNKQ